MASDRSGSGPLSKAIRWGEYLESHAQRIYHVASNPDIGAATALARKILKSEVEDGFALRDVYRHGWTGLTDRDAVRGGADLLGDLDWLRWTKEPTDGAPRVRYLINPKIGGFSPNAPAKTDKSPENDLPSVLSVASGKDSQDFRESANADPFDKIERDAVCDVEREVEEGDRED